MPHPQTTLFIFCSAVQPCPSSSLSVSSSFSFLLLTLLPPLLPPPVSPLHSVPQAPLSSDDGVTPGEGGSLTLSCFHLLQASLHRQSFSEKPEPNPKDPTTEEGESRPTGATVHKKSTENDISQDHLDRRGTQTHRRRMSRCLSSWGDAYILLLLSHTLCLPKFLLRFRQLALNSVDISSSAFLFWQLK